MKKFLVVFLILASCNNPYSRSYEYYEALAGHVVQIIITGKCNSDCINSIVSSELKYLTYTEAMYVLDSISKKLPGVFNSVERELEIKVEEKYKKGVTK
jgi:hypothetical protein